MSRGYDVAKARLVGTRILAVRKARGYTRREVAEAVGVPAPHLYRIEKGIRMAPIVLLTKLAEYLGVSTDSLVRETTDWKAEQTFIESLPPEVRDWCQGNEVHLWLTVAYDAAKQGLQPEDIADAIALLQAVKRSWNSRSRQ